MGSQRFPSKMMAELAGVPLIDWVLERVVAASRIDAVVLATSRASANDPLEAAAAAHGAITVRGDEEDVLSRFVEAALVSNADWIVRVCADNPFIDPAELDRLVDFALAARPDYAFNHQERMNNGYPDGFGAEIMSREALERIAAAASDPGSREHVTSYLWEHPEDFRIVTFAAPPALAYPSLRFDIDHPEDLARLEPLAARVGKRGTAAEFVRAELARS